MLGHIYTITTSNLQNNEDIQASETLIKLGQHPVTQPRLPLQPLEPRGLQSQYLLHQVEQKAVSHGASNYGNNSISPYSMAYSSEEDSDKENKALNLENNEEYGKKFYSRTLPSLKRDQLTNIALQRRLNTEKLVLAAQFRAKQAKIASFGKIRPLRSSTPEDLSIQNNGLKSYKSQPEVQKIHGLAPPMTQLSPHYHFPAHPHLNDGQVIRNGLVRHPQTGGLLHPAFISVSSTYGIITDLNRDIHLQDQYYARVMLP